MHVKGRVLTHDGKTYKFACEYGNNVMMTAQREFSAQLETMGKSGFVCWEDNSEETIFVPVHNIREFRYKVYQ